MLFFGFGPGAGRGIGIHWAGNGVGVPEAGMVRIFVQYKPALGMLDVETAYNCIAVLLIGADAVDDIVANGFELIPGLVFCVEIGRILDPVEQDEGSFAIFQDIVGTVVGEIEAIPFEDQHREVYVGAVEATQNLVDFHTEEMFFNVGVLYAFVHTGNVFEI